MPMPANQKGFAPLLVIVIILVGLTSAVYLVINGQNFFPSAQQDRAMYQGETSFSLSAGSNGYKPLPQSSPTNRTKDDLVQEPGGGHIDYHDPSIPMEATSAVEQIDKRPSPFYFPGQEFSVEVLVRSDIAATGKFNAHLSYSPDLVEIVNISPQMDPVKNCYDETKKSLVGVEYHKSRIIVGFKEGTTAQSAQELVHSLGAKYTSFNSDFNAFRFLIVNLPGNSDVVEWICKFRSQSSVSSAEVDGIAYANDSVSSGSAGVSLSNGSGTVQSGSATAEQIAKRYSLKSFITRWTGQHYNNSEGMLYLEGESNGGLFTIYNQPAVRMATITFRAKKAGTGELRFAESSGIFNLNNENILSAKRAMKIHIQEIPTDGPACNLAIPDCQPGYQPVPFPNPESTTTEGVSYCPRYSCVPVASPPAPPSPPPPPPMTACNLAIPNCADGQTLINNGPDDNHCPSYSCVYLGNPQVEACDPGKAIIIGDINGGEGRILCQTGDNDNKQTISYSFGDFNKDGKLDFGDLTYFFTAEYWQGN